MTRSVRGNERTKTPTSDANRYGFQWDWVTFVVALLIAIILAVVTFEVWVSHDFLPHG